MSRRTVTRCAVGLLLLATISVALVPLAGGDEKRSRNGLTEPIHRLSKRVEPQPVAKPEHPLDPALKVARDALGQLRTKVRDYSCTLVKQERVNGELKDQEYMYTEIRTPQVENGQVVVPFSVYMYFLKPSNMKGREVIYVEGSNNGKMVAHEGNFLRSFGAVWLKPDGPMAMRGNLYPITDVGVDTLIVRLIEKGERDRHRGECDVQFIKNATINKRKCTVLQVEHPTPRPHFDFHIAQNFIDDELNLPVRYAAYTWPNKPGGKPELLESYTYLNLKVNVGLTDEDFDREKKFRL